MGRSDVDEAHGIEFWAPGSLISCISGYRLVASPDDTISTIMCIMRAGSAGGMNGRQWDGHNSRTGIW